MKKLIKANDDVILTNVKNSKGLITHAIFAKLIFPGVKPINITYDVLNENVIVHEWYRIEDTDKINAILEQIKSHLKQELTLNM